MPMRDNFLHLISNLLERKGFLLSRMANIFFSFQEMGQNMVKQMEKAENHFPSHPFFQGSRNLILFFQIHPSKNEIVHKKLSSTPVC